jgi:hypothetical protein
MYIGYSNWHMSCADVDWLLAGSGWMSSKRLLEILKVNYRNKFKVNSASCWFFFHEFKSL